MYTLHYSEFEVNDLSKDYIFVIAFEDVIKMKHNIEINLSYCNHRFVCDKN